MSRGPRHILIYGDFMCTAITYRTDNFYFGRTLDNDFSYNETVTVTPRKFPFEFTNGKNLNFHYAIIGMAYVCENYPLYYDAVNEKGLCMAGLNFVGNAFFGKEKDGCDNIAVYEFIPWILSQCEDVNEAKRLLETINLTDTPFSKDLPTAQLHWLLADRNQTITIESMKDGLHIHNNPVGVLTNNPPFPYQMHNLNNYITLSPEQPVNKFSDRLNLKLYSRGMGAMGLPGDLSSQSRFVRASFVKINSVSDNDEKSSVNQFFHILGSVDQQRGCCKVGDKHEITVYSSCMNAERGIYYYTTYENHQISAVNIHKENIDGDSLVAYPLIRTEQIKTIN